MLVKHIYILLAGFGVSDSKNSKTQQKIQKHPKKAPKEQKYHSKRNKQISKINYLEDLDVDSGWWQVDSGRWS